MAFAEPSYYHKLRKRVGIRPINQPPSLRRRLLTRLSIGSLLTFLLVGIAASAYFAQASTTPMMRLIIGGVLCGLILLQIVLVVTTAHLLDNALFRPLQQLREYSQHIAEGDFDQHMPLAQEDEIGEFTTALHEMSQALRVRDRRIAAQNQALAEEVNNRKVAQEKLQKLNGELVQSSRYKDQFLATMSHELRTPLNAILGMSEALIVPVYGDLNDQQRKAILHVRDSGQHLLSLIDDILDLSKIAAGRSPLELAEIEVESVAEASLRLIRPIAKAKRIALLSHIDKRIHHMLADERRLKQILVNLLNNAVKFTPDGGTVSLDVKSNRSEEIIDFIVTDTGIGIPANSLDQLFEPFAQIDGSLARQHGGAGLGLTLVHRLVDMHDGSIRVESETGRGSQFRISLPWREAQRELGQSLFDIEQESAESATTILLAEDREANILTLLDYLTLKGYNVIVARNGREAVDMTRTQDPAIILMDIQMPEMSGLEAIEAIRTTGNTVPIIALTALAMPGDRERCLTTGADDYMSKPISLRQLVSAIEKLLNL